MSNLIKLSKVQLLKFFDINKVRYSKDSKEKKRSLLLLFTYILLVFIGVFYVSSLSIGVCIMGLGAYLPQLIFAVISGIILIFTIMKAGTTIFSTKDYEMLAALPIKTSEIVISRFVSIYLANLFFALIVLLPAVIIYSYYLRPTMYFYVIMFLSIFIIPLIPISIGVGLGALIVAITSKMRFKNIANIILSMGLFVILMGFSLSSSNATPENIANVAQVISDSIDKIYPLAGIFGSALVGGNLMDFIIFAGLSILIFIAVVVLISLKYSLISSNLMAKHKGKEYTKKNLQASRVITSLYKKEMKKYFSIPVYVMNTLVGYILTVAAAVAIFFFGMDKLNEMMEFGGDISLIVGLLPVGLALLTSMMSTTVSSVSLEGKNFWLLLSLPLSTKQIFDSKILVNLTLGIPTILISATLIVLAIPMGIGEKILIFLTPLVYLCFHSIVGITINCKMPNFQWDSEAEVVKRGGATFVAMVVGLISCLIPILIVALLKVGTPQIVTIISTIVLAGLSIILYNNNNKLDLRKL